MGSRGDDRSGDGRRPVRHSTRLGATVQRPGEPPLPTTVTDLSIDGCRINGYFRVDEPLSVMIERIGHFDAQVRWARLGSAGLQFARTKK